MSNTSDDDVPPLEDMSDEMKTRAELRKLKDTMQRKSAARKQDTKSGPSSSDLLHLEEKRHQGPMAVSASLEKLDLNVSASKVAAVQKSLGVNKKEPTSLPDKNNESVKPANNPGPLFTGLRKGFFSSAKPTAAKSVSKRKIPEPIEVLAPKQPAHPGKNLVFDEVQTAMKSKLQASTKDWMTSSFLSRIETNPILAKAFQDPEFQKATDALSKNPQAAFEKYARERPDLIVAMKEFSGLLGGQFETMAVAQEKGTAVPIPDDLCENEKELVRKVQSDKDLQDILRDAEIQSFLLSVRNNPPELQRALFNASPEMRRKIEKLIQCAKHYTKEHEWISVADGVGTFGISDYAQKALGDVVFIELPEVGASFAKKDNISAVESVKAASDIYAPVSGEVVAVNSALADEPSLINSSPEGEAWIAKIKLSNPAELEQLLDEASYAKHCDE
ncbi:hypothetical protein HDU80_010509 [Chytriomyces hyalinus]|nr:hypothetical protein HDU80_010509 [Chytriomyces hyalinus]